MKWMGRILIKVASCILNWVFELIMSLSEDDEDEGNWPLNSSTESHPCHYCGESVLGADPEAGLVVCEDCQSAIAEPGN